MGTSHKRVVINSKVFNDRLTKNVIRHREWNEFSNSFTDSFIIGSITFILFQIKYWSLFSLNYTKQKKTSVSVLSQTLIQIMSDFNFLRLHIVYIFLFCQSTHTININIKSQFPPWKNYIPFVLSTETWRTGVWI